MEDRRYWKGRTQEQTGREPAVFDLQQFQPTIKGNNHFITEKEGTMKGHQCMREMAPLYPDNKISNQR